MGRSRRYSDDDDDRKKVITITIYQNGDPSDPGTDVTFKQSKYNHDFDKLLDYINKKCSVFGERTGYTRLFTKRGHIVIDVMDFDDNGEYVASTGTYFIRVDYGSRALNLGGKTRRRRRDDDDDYGDRRGRSDRRSKSARPDSTRYSYYNRGRKRRSPSGSDRSRDNSRDRDRRKDRRGSKNKDRRRRRSR